jgi:hypothetical protein
MITLPSARRHPLGRQDRFLLARAARGGVRKEVVDGLLLDRWRVWKKRGLWQRILEALGDGELPGPVTKDAN